MRASQFRRPSAKDSSGCARLCELLNHFVEMLWIAGSSCVTTGHGVLHLVRRISTSPLRRRPGKLLRAQRSRQIPSNSCFQVGDVAIALAHRTWPLAGSSNPVRQRASWVDSTAHITPHKPNAVARFTSQVHPAHLEVGMKALIHVPAKAHRRDYLGIFASIIPAR